MLTIDPRGTRDGAGHLARPIQIPWTCHQTGDCCRAVTHVTVTKEERAILEAHQAAAVRPLSFVLHPEEEARIKALKEGGEIPLDKDIRFYQMEAKPCPFLSSQGLCTVHASRPYNCRRFMCGRVDVTQESFEDGGPMGCHNLSDRINTSLRFQEYFASHMRRAQKDWALSHGWTK